MEITKDDLEYLKTTIGWIIDNTIVNTDNRAYHETFHNSTLNSMEIVERALEKPDTSASGLHKHIVSQRSELLAFAKEMQNIGFNEMDDAEKVVDIYLKANCG